MWRTTRLGAYVLLNDTATTETYTLSLHDALRILRAPTADLRESQLELVRRLAHAAESRDDSTGIHITRMSRMCRELALEAGLGQELAEQLLHASSMHDIGKIAIPDNVLLKPGPLTPEEWEVMKSHTTIG